MKRTIPSLAFGHFAAFAILCASLAGCGRSSSDEELVVPRNPRQSAAQLERVFETAPAEVRQNVSVASESMQRGDYERAVASLEAVRASGNVTVQQGLAIHYSAVAMEANLVRAMEAGDPRAKRAYELLKRFKKN